MNINTIVKNELVEDRPSLFLLKGHGKFGYSDGPESEKYLNEVFDKATDLRSGSPELESHIKDWPSEYHLTPKRAQLLSGFSFNRSLKVLEVGCGCGAITRHLGENFDTVVAVEGSIDRARLARKRTKDLSSVSIVCAPFHDIEFAEKFDIIFCIGVYEYSASFVAAPNPYDAVLAYFSSLLNPDGMIVVAIENQFGIKYFNGAREDHLGTLYDGLEGYARDPGKVRTFGKVELEENLRKHFSDVQFYYPYPDYKIPDCVIAADLLATGQAGEIVSQMQSRDYFGPINELWDESAATLELSRNKMLEFFANSFLVLAGKTKLQHVAFDQLAVLYSAGRRPLFSTRTKVLNNTAGITVHKQLARSSAETATMDSLKLVCTQSAWVNTPSLQTELLLRSRVDKFSLSDIFEPCKLWLAHLTDGSTTEDGRVFVEGAHLDSIWGNTYIEADHCQFVDREWVWATRIPRNVIVIRAIHEFLGKAGRSHKFNAHRSGRKQISSIAACLGVVLSPIDFDDFVRLEVDYQWLVFGKDTRRHAIRLKWFLADRSSLRHFTAARRTALLFRAKMQRRIGRIAGQRN